MFPVGALVADAQDDAKLLYYRQLYNFELETNITTALKNVFRICQPEFCGFNDPKFWAALSLESIRVGDVVGGLEKGFLLHNAKIGILALKVPRI